MPRWEDEDEYLRHMERVMSIFDDPPTDEERIERMLKAMWVDILCEAVSESEPDWFAQVRDAYLDEDLMTLGVLISSQVKRYARRVAISRGIIDG